MDISNTKHFGNIYNLGGAHGVATLSEEYFNNTLLKLVEQSTQKNFVAVTNSQQNQAHQRLVALGFTETVIGNLIVHTATKADLLSPEVLKNIEKAKEERQAALDARPRNKDGRLLRADGTIIRHPYEYFVGDRVKFRESSYTVWENFTDEWKEGTVREVIGTGIHTKLKLRTKTIIPSNLGENIELIERIR